MSATPLDPSALRLGLGDVALLAQVRRPVASTWRSRSARGPLPFPPAVASARGRETFDGDEVVTWLETTGRGNNTDPRADLHAVASMVGAPIDDDVTFNGLSALMCLHAHADGLPQDAEDVLDLADEADPDDEYLFSELRALGDRLPHLTRYVRLRVEADYGVAASFDSLAAARRRSCAGGGEPRLTPEGMDLVVALVGSLVTQAGDGASALVDPTGVGSLAVEIARHRIEAGQDCSVAVPSATSISNRSLLRRLTVHGVPRGYLSSGGDTGSSSPGRAVSIVHLAPAGRAPQPEAEVLQTLDEAVLETPEHQRMVVLGPASALVDRLAAPQDRPGRPRRDAGRSAASALRDEVLRSRRVRCIVRLPAGLDPSRSRARTALWCLGPPPLGTSSDTSTVLVADLVNTPLDPAASRALVADLVAGTVGGRTWQAHAPTFLRPVLTRDLLARDGDLVRPALVRSPASVPGDLADEVASLTERARADLASVVVPPVHVREGSGGSISTTVGAALDRRDLLLLRGTRVADEDISDGGVPVIGPSDLDQLHAPTRRVDRLVMAARYPRATTTEPGDVIFTTSPRPRAVVDTSGGSLVAAPARVLRCVSIGLVPAVLVADIEAQNPTARAWRAWRIRQVPPEQSDALATALDQIAVHAAAARDRLAMLEHLSTVLVEGATSGVLDLVPTD